MNNVPALKHEQQAEIPHLAKTKGGVIIYPQLDVWSYRDSLRKISLNFASMPASAELILSAKQVLLWYAENLSPSHTGNMFEYLLKFLRFSFQSTGSKISEISTNHILSYRASLSDEEEYYLGGLKGFLLQWHSMRLPGVIESAARLLKRMRLKGNLKGHNVLTMHATKGPFTELEWQALHMALQVSYEEKRMGLEDYLLAWLIIALGQRPIQYAALKISDFYTSTDDNGHVKYFLRVPKAKQRGSSLRDSYNEHVLVSEIGSKLAFHVEAIRARFSSILTNPQDAPLFPEHPLRSTEDKKFIYHQVAHDLSVRFQEILNPLKVYSERTGQLLHITPRRLRLTYGTRMAAEGYGERVIAANLGHSDTQNVAVYTAHSPAIIERIDKALAMRLAPLVRAFRGEVIEDESKATRASDLASRICDPRFGANSPVGSCADSGACGRFAPLSCYICMHFQPWRDGPHDELLRYLLDERERLVVEHGTRIASVQDRAILAVAEVVKKCEANLQD